MKQVTEAQHRCKKDKSIPLSSSATGYTYSPPFTSNEREREIITFHPLPPLFAILRFTHPNPMVTCTLKKKKKGIKKKYSSTRPCLYPTIFKHNVNLVVFPPAQNASIHQCELKHEIKKIKI